MKKFFYTIWICIYPIAIYYVVQIWITFATMAALVFLGVDGGYSFIEKYALVITAVAAVIAFIPLAAFFYADNKKIGSDNADTVVAKDYIMAALGGAGISIIVNVIVEISGLSKFDQKFMEVSRSFDTPPVIVSLICAGIIVPIVEELLFRGLVFKRIKRQYNAKLAIVLSALLFGYFHGNLTQGVFATILGLCMAYVYNGTGTLLLPICIHMSANTSALILSEITQILEAVNPIISSIFIILFLVICVVISILSIIYFKTRKTSELKAENIEIAG